MPIKPAHSYRDDAAVPSFPDDRPLIVFDGVCALCSGFVRFVLRHDPGGHFRFVPAQSALGTALYRHYGLDPDNWESNLLIAEGRLYLRSDAAIEIVGCFARRLARTGEFYESCRSPGATGSTIWSPSIVIAGSAGTITAPCRIPPSPSDSWAG